MHMKYSTIQHCKLGSTKTCHQIALEAAVKKSMGLCTVFMHLLLQNR